MLARSAGGISAISDGPSARRLFCRWRSCWYCESPSCSRVTFASGSRKAVSCSCRSASTAASSSGTSCIRRPCASPPSPLSEAGAGAAATSGASCCAATAAITTRLSCSMTASSDLRRSSTCLSDEKRSSPHCLIISCSSAVLRFSLRSSSKYVVHME